MPPRKKARKNALAAARVGGRDDISNLPDDVLQHMLSFLPAQDAVRTCVLAKRWRHLWKSTTGLRFVCGGYEEPSLEEIQDLTDHLLRLRISDGVPLDMCEFDLGGIDEDEMSRVSIWISLALQCKVQVLRFSYWVYNLSIGPQDGYPILISQYLKKLELDKLDSDIMPSRLLDFCYCPILEDLKIVECNLSEALLILSESLKRLTIDRCSFDGGCRMPICAPNLVSLWLEVDEGRTPSLQRMPSLITAYVKINSYDDQEDSIDFDDYNNQSILLQGLSEVGNLSLIAPDDEMFIFRRDLKFCSSFNNLKSLLLDEYWCEPADFSALACILKLCPVLEKLTLQLYSEGPNHKVEIKLSCKPLEISTEISQHLKTLEVNCEVYDKRVRNVLTFLSKKLNMWFQFNG